MFTICSDYFNQEVVKPVFGGHINTASVGVKNRRQTSPVGKGQLDTCTATAHLVAQTGSLLYRRLQPASRVLPVVSADCQSATQQVTNLRYGVGAGLRPVGSGRKP